VPVEEYASNIRAIVTKLKSNGVSNIIVITPPPVDDTAGRFKNDARNNTRVKSYAAVAIEVARSMGMPHIDLHTKIQVSLPSSSLHRLRYCSSSSTTGCMIALDTSPTPPTTPQPNPTQPKPTQRPSHHQANDDWRAALMNADGLHMSRAGNQLIYDNVMTVVNEAYPSLHPQQLPLHFPAFNQINVQHPDETFDALYSQVQAMLQAAGKAPVPVGRQAGAGALAMERGAVAAPVVASAGVSSPAAGVPEAGPAPGTTDSSPGVAATLLMDGLSFTRGGGQGEQPQPRQQLIEPAQAIAVPAEQPPAAAAAVAAPTVLEGRRRRQRAHR